VEKDSKPSALHTARGQETICSTTAGFSEPRDLRDAPGSSAAVAKETF